MTGTHSFTLAYWCVFIAAMLPFVCAYIAKAPGFRKPRKHGGFDNDHPREWLAKQSDYQQRANAAQANSFEALPFFIAAVLVAHQVGAAQGVVDILSVIFITLRIVYIAMYVANLATVRSIIWFLALLVNAAIFFSGLRF